MILMENKLQTLAHTIVNYSLDVQENEKVLIKYRGFEPNPLVKELIKELNKKHAVVVTKVLNEPEVVSLLEEGNSKESVELSAKQFKFEVENFDSFINIIYNMNDYEGKNQNKELKRLLGEKTKKDAHIRTNERKWVLLNYPSNIDAFKAKMEYKEFYDYALDVMTVDYAKMAEDIKPLKELMEKTDKVRVTGKDTDITFSIKGIPAIPCVGNMNIPDGEIFTAPVKDSVNGKITYNTPSPYEGKLFHHVSLEFKDGKIIKATCDEDDNELNEIFDRDEGARYVGEFSFGLNPKIKEPIGDILFDEKIIGSIHFTPGKAYDEAPNGNESMIHWDMVLIQREEWGGGEIYFDDVLIRKNGKFVLKELEHLNYE